MRHILGTATLVSALLGGLLGCEHHGKPQPAAQRQPTDQDVESARLSAEPHTKAAWLNAVHLDSAADLEQLRATNPDHYARAVRILAAGVQLCGPGKPKLQNVDAQNISCSHLLLTSNPPKSRLDFVLDNTQYVAIVTMVAASPDNHVTEPQLPKR